MYSVMFLGRAFFGVMIFFRSPTDSFTVAQTNPNSIILTMDLPARLPAKHANDRESAFVIFALPRCEMKRMKKSASPRQLRYIPRWPEPHFGSSGPNLGGRYHAIVAT